MASQQDFNNDPDGQEDAMLDADEAAEILEEDDDVDMDAAQGDNDEDEGYDDDRNAADQTLEEIQLRNDSVAHFDKHSASIFCIAQHPRNAQLVATGAGDDVAYVWDIGPRDDSTPVLPRSYESNPQPLRERESIPVKAVLGGQDESVNAICFTLPDGQFIVTGTLAGKLSVFATPSGNATAKQDSAGAQARLVASAKEVEEINWISPCPNPHYPNTIAFGASDGSVWVYSINTSNDPNIVELSIVQTFFLHQAPCTAGAWTPDGKLLATVAEDSSLYVWDVFGDAAGAGVVDPQGSQAIVNLTVNDERFKVEGGLYSVAISPGGGIVAVGGAEGNIRVVSLPRLSVPTNASNATAGKGAKGKTGQASSKAASTGQAGQLLASLQVQSDGVETLDFGQPPLTLLAAGSVDGSVALFDAAHNFAVRRLIPSAHEDEAVIKVEFVKTKLGTPNPGGHLLTTCGNDGVIRRWDVRGGSTAGGKGLVGEWAGHRGGGEGGGILGFVQGDGGARVITAGDDGVSLVFDTPV